MIAIGGIIGAGLFVGSSASIATVGPAVIVSYGLAGLLVLLVMRLISEMSVADPTAGSFTELIRGGLGNWGGFVFRLALLVFLGRGGSHRNPGRGGDPAQLAAAGDLADRHRAAGLHDRHQPDLGAFLWRV